MADPYKSFSKRPTGLKDDIEEAERKEKKAPAVYCTKAKELAAHTEKTVHQITKPNNGKGHRFLIGTEICDTAYEAMSACYHANEIFPLSVKDYMRRRELLQQALGALSTLEALIEIAKENVEFSSSILKEWTKKLNDANKYVKAVYKSDLDAMNKMIASRGPNNYVNATDLIAAISSLIR